VIRAGGSRLARDEAGQALLMLLMAMVGLIALGMLVFWLALSTNYATVAQTAADAAALAAERNVVDQLQQPSTFVNGQWVPPQVNWGLAQEAASSYAADNGAKVYEFDHDNTMEPWGGYDVTVIVETLKGLPANSVEATKEAFAAARASTDPLSVSSPPNPNSNDASLSTTHARWTPHPGARYGLFPNAGVDYSTGQESSIAGTLDQFAIKNKIQVIGVLGDVHAPSPGDTNLQTCGDAITVTGLPGPKVTGFSDKDLSNAGLERVFPARTGQPDEIALAGTPRSACAQGASTTPPTTGQPAPVAGNSDVHLVDLNGGPTGTLVGFPIGGIAPIAGPWVIPTAIVMCESGGKNWPPNSATASGYYQILTSTWLLYGGGQYTPQAYLAPKPIQDLIAARIWDGGRGAGQWNCTSIVGWHA
jgi:Transglycosylase-like domain